MMFKTTVIHTRSTFWTAKEQTNEEMLVDAEDLAREIEIKTNELYENGYDILNITPISSGNLVNGTGYYHTESVIITAKKRQ
jgi:hypothetical protein